jgi:hypothetical protein
MTHSNHIRYGWVWELRSEKESVGWIGPSQPAQSIPPYSQLLFLFLPSIHWGENYINVKDFMTNVLFPVRILLSRLIRTQ